MGIFDIFSPPTPDTAAPQIAGLNAGYGLALPALQQGSTYLRSGAGQGSAALTSGAQQGSQDLTGYYTSALSPFMQNYNQAQAGTNAYGNAVGPNGPQGNAQATQAFWNNPAIQSQLDVGSQNVLRNEAAAGQLNSGATDTALQKTGQDIASQGWNSYISSLAPYFNQANQAAQGQAAVNTGLGTALNANQMNLGTQLNANQQNLGTQLNANQANIGGLGYATQTGIGNATANQNLYGAQADLAGSANFWNFLGGLGGMKTTGGGSLGGNALTGLAGMLPFSDERLKEDIKQVGELYDGQNVYSFRYKGDYVPRIGLMAQEVERTNPDAVVEHPSGYKMVDYQKATRYSSALARFLEAA